MKYRDFGIIDYETLVSQEPIAIVKSIEHLPAIGIAWDRLQNFASYRVREYQGKKVIAMASEYGRPPYTVYPFPEA